MVFTCAISGQPCTEPVASPGGQIYERRLILTKLAENSNTDPFQKERPLTEDQLIALDVSSRVTPPARAPTVSSLLDMLQREHDALLLELFDTRQALEETRRELSQALYQNDAAVRVISRLVMERDGAKAKLATFEQSAGVLHPPVSTNVESMQVDSSSTAVVEDEVKGEAADKSKSMISDDDMAVMVDTWKKLSKARKKRSPTFPTFEDLSKYTEIDTKSNLHRTNKPGANCLAVIPKSKTIISGGVDKTTVIYNTDTQTVTATLTGSKGEITCVEANEAFVLTGSADGVARVYHTDKDYELVGSYDLGSPCTGVSIHPTGKYVFLVSKAGRIVFCDDNLTELATFNDDGESEYTCVGMHPDGLILGIGTTDGKLKILDLKSQKFASTLEGHKGVVTSVSFSENGYHFASSSSEVIVWDLRKLKVVKTLNESGQDLGNIGCVKFDHSGKYLAYCGVSGTRISVVKDWEKTLTFEGHKKRVTAVSWGDDASSWFVTAGLDKFIKIFGQTTDDKMETK